MLRLLCVLVVVAAVTVTAHPSKLEGVANLLRTFKGLLERFRGDSNNVTTNTPPTDRSDAFEGQQYGEVLTLMEWQRRQEQQREIDQKLELLRRRLQNHGGYIQ